ncbi:MAG: peptidoglycan-binding protein, partial [Gracilibacteraceae bacterium]|nr:peptidoglycan-binding protein [Gracilibacteraceae bacterium]
LRIAVTEGNNFYNVSTEKGHNLLKYQINKADEIGCEQFCFPYVNWMHNAEEDDSNMSYCWNWNPVSPYWQDMLSLIKSKDTQIILELDGMKLVNLKIGSKGNQVKWLQEILELEYGFENTGGYDGKFGALTDMQVRQYQAHKGLTIDGIVGKDTTFDLIWEAKEYGKDYWYKKLEIYMAFE